MYYKLRTLYKSFIEACITIKWRVFNAYLRLRKKHIRGWYKGTFNESLSHIEICHQESIILATIGANKIQNKVIVDFKSLQDYPEHTLPELKILLQSQISLLNTLFNREMPISDRWEYAKYHCSTTSNIYSKINTDVYWRYKPASRTS